MSVFIMNHHRPIVIRQMVIHAINLIQYHFLILLVFNNITKKLLKVKLNLEEC